jgi:hypothetical protein
MNISVTHQASTDHSADSLADELLSAELASIARTVVVPFAAAEADFLAIGDRLGEAAGILGGLTSLFDALPMQLEHSDIDDATSHFAAVAVNVTGMASALASEKRILAQLQASNIEVSAQIDRLRSTISAISVLAVNARIEAAHIGTDGADFSVFTDSIRRLVMIAGNTIKRFSDEHGRLLDLLKSASTKQAAFEKNHGESLRLVVQRLDAGLSSVAERRALASAAAANIGAKTKQIAREIGAAVSALQISDITRQRAEHVGHALETLALGLGPVRIEPERPADKADWGNSLASDQRRTVISAVSQIQSAQLLHAADAFEQEVSRIIAALGDLAESARTIIRTGAEVYGASGGEETSFLAELGREVRMVNSLMVECGAARSEVDRVASEAGASLKELLAQIGSIRQIEVEMRLIGLNTILRCGTLGNQGRTLRVIAQELRGFANQTIDDAQGVISALDAVAYGADELTRKTRARQDDQALSLDERMSISLQRLENVGSNLSKALATLQGEGSRAAALLNETATGIRVHRDVCHALRDGRGRLEQITGASSVREADMDMVRDQVLSLFEGRYTMASEREIHDMVFGRAGDNPGDGAEQAASEVTVDDLLF